MAEDDAPAADPIAWGAVYGALAASFEAAEPDQARFQLDLVEAEVTARPALRPPLEGLPALRERLESTDPEGFRLEQTRLFSLGQGRPYEASYDAEIRRLALIADVAGFYRAFGLEVTGDRPDFLVAELQFLSYLAVLEERARLSGEQEHREIAREARKGFLTGHAGRWLPAFAAHLASTSRMPFYADLASLLVRVARADARDLGVQVEEVTVPDMAPGGDTPSEDVPPCGAPALRPPG